MGGSILDGIGNTPLVALRRVVPPGSARLVAKLESANPTGSMKDRMARAAIAAAAADGRLPPGGTAVEYTAGTTGISLALACTAMGFGLRIVTSDAFAAEKLTMMRALGAEVTALPAEGGRIDAALVRRMIEAAQQMAAAPGHWLVDQLANPDATAGYHPLGEEILAQAGPVEALVQSVGTGHALQGMARALRARLPRLHVCAVEPAESAVLSGGPSGAHRIEGIGVGFVPPLWRPEEADEIIPVSSAEAMAMARRLAQEEGIFAGISSGANVVAALRVAARLGPGATVATLICDSGLRYLSTELWRG
jgi:cysteine synthase A